MTSSPAGRSATRRAGTGLVVFLLALLMGWSSASAHSGLAAASPGPGAIVGGDITEIELWYNSAITDITASVTAPDGTVLDGTLVQVSELRMTVELDAPLSIPGEYAVRHGTTGVEDGDRLDAAFLFTYDPDAPPPVLDLLPVGDEGIALWLWIVIGVGVVVIAVLAWRLLSSIRRARDTAV